MIEYTLQEAIEKCTDEGGRFRRHDREQWLILGKPDILVEKTNCFATFSGYDFETMWIYEPPKQSTFHVWHTQFNCVLQGVIPFEIQKVLRKEGWVGAVGRIIKMEETRVLTKMSPLTFMKALKELEKG